MNTRHLGRLLLLGGIVLLPTSVRAATLKYGADADACGGTGSCTGFPGNGSGPAAIQDLIDQAIDGDEVHVYAGTYYENLVIDAGAPASLTLKAAAGAEQTAIIDGGGAGPVLSITGGQAESLVVSGLTIQNGQGVLINSKYYGGGLYVDGSSPVLENLLVTSSTATNGGGVYLEDASPTMDGLWITANKANFGGGVFMIRSSPLMRNLKVYGNTIPNGATGGTSGAGVYIQADSAPLLEESLITGNTGVLRGGGLYIYAGSAPQLVGVQISENSAGYGGGVYLSQAAWPTFVGVLINGNAATATTTNVTPPGGGGVYLYDAASPLFVNTTIADNTVDAAAAGGSEIFTFGSYPRLINSLVSNELGAGKSLIHGYDFQDGSSRPGQTGADLQWCGLYESVAGTRFGGDLSTTTVLSSNGATDDPGFEALTYRLAVGSPYIDGGHPEAQYDDMDASRSDTGAFGGPLPLVLLDEAAVDSDDDGMMDDWETAWFGDLSRGGAGDYDADSLTDAEEYAVATNPTKADSDFDGWSDSAEVSGGDDPLSGADHRPQAAPLRDRVALVGESVALDGSASSDPDGATLTYTWTLEIKPGGSALGSSLGSSSSASLTPDVVGIYLVRLKVEETGAHAAVAERDIRVYVGAETVLSDALSDSIQNTIDAMGASDYGTITLADGTWTGPVDFGGKILRLRSANGSSAATIQVSSGSVVKFRSGESAASVLQGFTLRGGLGTVINSQLTGGGVIIESASPTLVDLIVTQNQASFGGGLAILNGSPELINVGIEYNKAVVGGAGVYAYGGAPHFTKGWMTNNGRVNTTDLLLGGAMFAYGSSFEIAGTGADRVEIRDNTASEGGGLYLMWCEDAQLSLVDLDQNVASTHGGALSLLNRSHLTARGLNIRANSADTTAGYGGVARLSGSSYLEIMDSIIGSVRYGTGQTTGANQAAFGGAVALLDGSSFLARMVEAQYNTAARDGGFLYHAAKYEVGWPKTRIDGSILRHNEASTGAGGVAFLTGSARLELLGSTVSENVAGTLGGVAAVGSGDNLIVRNSLLLANQAATGGVVAVSDSGYARLENNTLAGNTAVTAGATLASLNSASAAFLNNIVVDSAGVAALAGGSQVAVTYSAFFSNDAGDNEVNITLGAGVLQDQNPQFLDYSDTAPADPGSDFRLTDPGSPCLAAGQGGADMGAYGGAGAATAAGVDQDADGMVDVWEIIHLGSVTASDGSADADADGQSDLVEHDAGTDPRDTDTDGDGTDDFADLSPLDPISIGGRPLARAGYDFAAEAGKLVQLDASLSSDAEKRALTYAWSWVSPTEGAPTLSSATAARPTFTPASSGDYTLSLTVTAGGFSSDPVEVTVHVPAEPITVCASGCTYADLAEAVGEASPWSVIKVSAGTYTLSSSLTLGTTPMTLVSVSGADATIIDGPDDAPAVKFLGSPATVRLEGFTIKDAGSTSSIGGGIYMSESFAVVQDCIIRDNLAATGAGVYIYRGAPALVRNRIFGNTAQGHGGGVLITSASGAWLMNNQIVRNQGSYGGGLLAYASLINFHFNTVVSNVATSYTGNAMHLSSSAADVRNNLFVANGEGSIVTAGGSDTVDHNLFYANGCAGCSVGTNALTSDPLLNAYTYYPRDMAADSLLDDFRVRDGSPAVNAADEAIYAYTDAGGSAPDLGAFGGPRAFVGSRINRVVESVTPVTGRYLTIQSAMAATLSGDRVEVGAGTFAERLDFAGKDITVRGAYGSDTDLRVIDGAAQVGEEAWQAFLGSVVTFDSGEGAGAILEGFTLKNGWGNSIGTNFVGGGVEIMGSSPTIRNCTITTNDTTGGVAYGLGGGVFIRSGDPALEYVTVSANDARFGGGIYVEDSQASFDHVTVLSNTADVDGGGLYIKDASPSFTNLTVDSNVISYGWSRGGGIFISGGAPTLGVGSDIKSNSATFGGGIYLTASSPSLQDLTVRLNTATFGGGIYSLSATPDLSGVTIKSNTASSYGGGMALMGTAGSSLSWDNLQFLFNETTAYWGGGLFAYDAIVGLTNVLFQENVASFYGGGLLSLASSVPVTNAVFAGNEAGFWKGGGMTVMGVKASNPVSSVRNSIFLQNAGGGLVSYDQTPAINYCDFYGNVTALGETATLNASTASGPRLSELGTGNLTEDPLVTAFTADGAAGTADSFALNPSSLCVDAGDPDVAYDDVNTTRNDMGMYGGPGGEAW